MIELGVGFRPESTVKEKDSLGASIHGLKRREISTVCPSVVEFPELKAYMKIS